MLYAINAILYAILYYTNYTINAILYAILYAIQTI